MAIAKKKVLVCDDDPDLRTTLRLLIGDKYQVLEAGDGVQALRLIEKDRPELLLLDMNMPGLGGPETLEIIRKIDAGMIIVIISGVDEIHSAQEMLERGANAYVTKPFDMERLKADLNRHLQPATSEPDKLKVGYPWRVEAAKTS